MKLQSPVLVTMLLLFCASLSLANPGPWPSSENRFSILQTIELTLHFEHPVSQDSMSSAILYMGPTLINVISPSEHSGIGVGLELGGEIRKYFLRSQKDLFLGIYLGGGVTWMNVEESVSAISSGIKIGWKLPIAAGAMHFDLEPYTCVGVKLLSNEDDGGSFDGAFYLGFKVDIY